MATEIECTHASCPNAATTGGIAVVQPNGLKPSHAIYYACDDHPEAVGNAEETWQVRQGGDSRG